MREKWASRRQEGADFNARVDLTTVCEAVLQDIDNLLAHQESEVLTLAEAERSVHRRLSRPYPSPALLAHRLTALRAGAVQKGICAGTAEPVAVAIDGGESARPVLAI